MKSKSPRYSITPLKFVVPLAIHYVANKRGWPKDHVLSKWASKYTTNLYAGVIQSRPITETLKQNSPLAWSELTDKKIFARHLSPAQEYNAKLKNEEKANTANIAENFIRPAHFFREGRSNLFFTFFAQWFTDGFFRSSLIDPKKTGANHHVELCQIYGLNKSTTDCLRLHSNGYLRYQGEKGNELPPALYKKVEDHYEVEEPFEKLSYLQTLSDAQIAASGKPFIKNELELVIARSSNSDSAKAFNPIYNSLKPTLLASGLERGNSTIGNLIMNTFFLRCHNRICDELIKLPDFNKDGKVDDESVFQIARAINITLLIKFTIEEYISHIAGNTLFRFDPSYAEKQQWYREPWLAAEFNLLYRWHGLIPNAYHIDQNTTVDFRVNSVQQLNQHSLEVLLKSACKQAAGVIQAGNTPPYLKNAEQKMLNLGREWQLQPYNEYRKAFGLKPLKSIDKLTKSPRLRAQLKETYGSIDNVEFVSGIYHEDPYKGQIVGELQSVMVAYDAFTQLYTNPLVSEKNHERLLKNSVANDWIKNTSSLDQLVSRVLKIETNEEVSFDNPRCKKEPSISTPKSQILKQTGDNRSLKNVLCPHLRVGINSGNLPVDKNGWIKKNQLEAFLVHSGLKKNSLLIKALIFGGINNSPMKKNRLVNLYTFRKTSLDHGSSSGVLNNTEGLNKENLIIFKKHSQAVNNEQRLYTEEFRKIAKELHHSPVNFKASSKGHFLQILEFKIILEVYGRKDNLRKQKYLTYDDIVSLWKHSRLPQGWNYPVKSKIGLLWTIKTLYQGYLQARKNLKSDKGSTNEPKRNRQSNRDNTTAPPESK